MRKRNVEAFKEDMFLGQQSSNTHTLDNVIVCVCVYVRGGGSLFESEYQIQYSNPILSSAFSVIQIQYRSISVEIFRHYPIADFCS